MPRPSIDVVVPFVGSDEALSRTVEHVRRLDLAPGDTLTVVDNRPRGSGAAAAPEVLSAPERQSSYFARNAGARRGSGEWLVFLDADVRAPSDLLARYFAAGPAAGTGVLAGGITTTLEAPTAVARWGYYARQLSPQGAALTGFEYAQTANAAFRRSAFEAVGGFCDHVRSGGDAELSFRLQKAGWTLERRHEAAVEHPSRSSVKAVLRLFARYGSGAEWVAGRHPGFRPPRSRLGVTKWFLEGLGRAALAYAGGHRELAVRHALDPGAILAFELGRSFSNEIGAAPTGLVPRVLARLAGWS